MTQIIEKPEIPHDLKEIDEDCLIYDKEFGWLPRFNGLMKLANTKGILLFTKAEIVPIDKGVCAIAQCELIPKKEYFAERMGLKPIIEDGGKVADWTYVDKEYENFIYNNGKIIASDVGEANALNLGNDFLPYMSATAITRAQARALKKLLNIKYMVAEEVKFEKAMKDISVSKKSPAQTPLPKTEVGKPSDKDKDSITHLTSQVEQLMKGDKGAIAIVTSALNKSGRALKDMDIFDLQLLLNTLHEHKKKLSG